MAATDNEGEIRTDKDEETIEMTNALNAEDADRQPEPEQAKNKRIVWSNKLEYYSALIGHSLSPAYLMILSYSYYSLGKYI